MNIGNIIMVEHKIDCAINAAEVCDEFAAMGCTCGASKINADSESCQVDTFVIKPLKAINWYLVLQGLNSYKATYRRLEKDNLLKDYELHEYEVIIEAIEELEKAL